MSSGVFRSGNFGRGTLLFFLPDFFFEFLEADLFFDADDVRFFKADDDRTLFFLLCDHTVSAVFASMRNDKTINRPQAERDLRTTVILSIESTNEIVKAERPTRLYSTLNLKQDWLSNSTGRGPLSGGRQPNTVYISDNAFCEGFVGATDRLVRQCEVGRHAMSFEPPATR